jgi:release factor glutamine methyltransferase
LALDGGHDGLKVIGDLLDQAQRVLARPGFILLEIEAGIGDEALKLAKMNFPASEITLHKDLTGRDRLVEIIQN